MATDGKRKILFTIVRITTLSVSDTPDLGVKSARE